MQAIPLFLLFQPSQEVPVHLGGREGPDGHVHPSGPFLLWGPARHGGAPSEQASGNLIPSKEGIWGQVGGKAQEKYTNQSSDRGKPQTPPQTEVQNSQFVLPQVKLNSIDGILVSFYTLNPRSTQSPNSHNEQSELTNHKACYVMSKEINHLIV